MARRKQRTRVAPRRLHLESVESRLALSATAESPAVDFQFDGAILERWLDEQAKSDTALVAPIAPGTLPPETIQNLLTIVTAVDSRSGGTFSFDRVRDWLDRRGVEFSFTLPATDGGYIDLTVPSNFGGPGGLGSYEESGSGELFGSPGGPATPGELGSLDEPAPSTSPQAPVEPGSSTGQGGAALEAWSSLGRPAVIATDGALGDPTAAANVKYARAAESGGWIALEPILAQSDLEDIESLHLASPDTNDAEHGAASADLKITSDDALAGEWARAAVFEMIGGDPTETQPAGRATSGRQFHLKQDTPALSGDEDPAPELGATGIHSQAVLLLSGSGWLDDLAAWVNARAGTAIDNLFTSDEDDDASGAVTGWRDYAGAGALLLALALERIAAGHRDDRQSADAAHREKLRLRRAEFANRLTMRLNPIETR